MSFIKPFGELGKNDAAIAGGKGASLGEMTQASNYSLDSRSNPSLDDGVSPRTK